MGSVADTEFRLFTATDGRTIEARILEYNPARNKLRIERRGNSSLWVDPEIFSVSDRKYIKEWVSASMFLVSSSLKISLKKVHKGNSGSKKSFKETEKICYEVKLQNRSKQPLNISKMEFCYYVRNTKTRGAKDSEWSDVGRMNVGVLKPAETKVLITSSLSLSTIYREQAESGRDIYGNLYTSRSIVKVSEDKLRGIWIRVYGPEVGGQLLYRDVSFPKDLIEKVAWNKVSSGVEGKTGK